MSGKETMQGYNTGIYARIKTTTTKFTLPHAILNVQQTN